MSHNAIGEGGGQAMAEMLEVNQSLRVLDLGNTELGMRSLVALATSLNHHNRSLHYLNVDNPHLQSIQEEASLHFTRMLAVNDTLRCLKFAKHSMRDHGCLTMVPALLSPCFVAFRLKRTFHLCVMFCTCL